MCTCVTLVQIILAKHHYISPRLNPSSCSSSLSKFFREYDTVSKGKEEQKFPLQLFDTGFGFVGGGFFYFVVVVLKALIYLFDSLKKFSGIRESCEGAQQLHHKPKHQACKQV